MGGIEKTFAWLGRKIEKGLGVASEKTKKIGHDVYDFTIEETHRQQKDRFNKGNLHRIYKAARSRNIKQQGPALSWLHDNLGNEEGKMSPQSFAQLMLDEYGDADALEYFKDW